MKKIALAALLVLVAAVLIAWPREDFIPSASPTAWAATPDNIARGAYLARAGDCLACHTARGGAEYAGGRALDTPFGRLYGPNLTPDAQAGIGSWDADDFWNALHNGKSRDGRLLYPAFPYTNYTKVSRADSDALFAYFRSLPPQREPNKAHELDFPYNQQALLALWRLLYFKPATFTPQPARGAEWNRGAYLVEGLGHCSACHSTRNRLGASGDTLSGGLIPTIGWYAPSLTSSGEAGMKDWDQAHIVALLQTGVSPRGSATGPMAEVVARSLQHLTGSDVGAMASYLKSLPSTDAPAPAKGEPASDQLLAEGRRLYGSHCIDCHGADGKGKAPAYPPLAGNRAVTLTPAVNAIRMVLNGGFPPGTAGNPRPYGMPPYSHELDDAQVAAVLTYVRASWGNAAAPVSVHDVNRYRSVPLD
ncbi:c-type cytochrome [Massilia yuzhufengensis]|uniref:Cytochrome c, mono-and diheme variants n=1 Tax=Massilia yuzhufengensis TaxID=1164594 RepID=A0A1I1EWQ2_9BURK|nr:cytochrome c [Massilia yuzhufengensis]SFB91524.1 Cytochrome c, mono-and diheme variants [Massilia yuzhufengensis]